MKKITIVLFAALVLVGCSKEFQTKFIETSIGTYADDFDDVSKFSSVYGMWKDNIDTLYIQAGNDEYTDTYLLETMPSSYSTIIKSLNKYDMKAYALLDNDVWLTENNETMKEIRNVLNYNSNFEDERFKGININSDLENITDRQLEVYYRNLEEAKQAIDTHNDSTGDNLILSINVDNKLLNNNNFLNVARIVDKVIYEDDSIENVEELLSIMDEYDKDVEVVVDLDKGFFDNNYVSILKNLNNKLDNFNKYDSFNGLVINDYGKYNDFMKEQKRP